MNGIGPDVANAAVRQMVSAQGRRVDADVVEEFSKVIQEAVCPACALKVFEIWRTEKTAKTRLPSGPELRAEIREMGATSEHAYHAGHDAREVTASELETFWRTTATRLILPRADGDQHLAAFVAAQMWWVGIEPTDGSVEFELEDASRTWIQSAFTHCEADGLSTEEHAERAFARARKAATSGAETVSDAELAV